jgi:hypothetical protein
MKDCNLACTFKYFTVTEWIQLIPIDIYVFFKLIFVIMKLVFAKVFF